MKPFTPPTGSRKPTISSRTPAPGPQIVRAQTKPAPLPAAPNLGRAQSNPAGAGGMKPLAAAGMKGLAGAGGMKPPAGRRMLGPRKPGSR